MSARPLALALVALGLAGCGSQPSGNQAAATLPGSGGDVWSIDPASPPDAQVLAFLYGMHRFVLDDDEIYTATTKLEPAPAEGAVAAAKLAGDLALRIEAQGGQPILVFSSGQRAPLRKYQAPEGDR
ncbi:MAG: hypothetical protein AB7P31_03125 [Steroidobacteraceae bacterium]